MSANKKALKKNLSLGTAIVTSLVGASLILSAVNAKAASIDSEKQVTSESSSHSVLVSSAKNASAAIDYYNQGVSYSQQKQYRQAIALYNKAIKLDRKLADAYNNRGVAYALLKNYKKGIADLKIAVRLYQQQGDAASAQKAQRSIQIIREEIRLSKVRPRRSNVSTQRTVDPQAVNDRVRDQMRAWCAKAAANIAASGGYSYCDGNGSLQNPRVIYRRY
jgi:tetratricopeptide (TPR) repeat protein